MQATAEQELRAYVASTSAKLKYFGSLPIELAVEFQNSGSTPAKDVETRVSFSLVDYFPKQKLIAIGPEPRGAYVLPGGVYTVFLTGQLLSGQTIQQLKAGTKALYVFGSVDYLDVFEKRCRTEFRYICGGEHSDSVRTEK